MKTYKDYLIDFDTIKVGDSFYSLQDDRMETISLIRENKDGEIALEISTRKYSWIISYLKLNNGKMFFSEKPDFFKEKKEVKRWRWYYEFVDNGLDMSGTSKHLTNEEVLIYFKENFNKNQITGYGIIPCTEKTGVVYE